MKTAILFLQFLLVFHDTALSVFVRKLPRCGGGRNRRVPYVIHGQKAGVHEFPWLVNIRSRSAPTVVRCGGSLITDKLVLTAAHCVYNSHMGDYHNTTDLWVYLGTHSVKHPDRYEIRVPIRRFTVHPNYVSGHYRLWAYDIAIVELSFPVTGIYAEKYISPICLPCQGPNITPFEPQHGETCIVAGWGVTENHRPSDVPMKTQLRIQERSVCNAERFWGGHIDGSMLCGGDTQLKAMSCVGDSGGPLMCLRGDQWYVSGVVSWGALICGSKPAVFSNVIQATEWLADVLRHYGSSEYCPQIGPPQDLRPPPTLPPDSPHRVEPCGAELYDVRRNLFLIAEQTEDWQHYGVESGEACIMICCGNPACKSALYYPDDRACFLHKQTYCDVGRRKVDTNYSADNVVYYGKRCLPARQPPHPPGSRRRRARRSPLPKFPR